MLGLLMVTYNFELGYAMLSLAASLDRLFRSEVSVAFFQFQIFGGSSLAVNSDQSLGVRVTTPNAISGSPLFASCDVAC
jgi:hypothetical protein